MPSAQTGEVKLHTVLCQAFWHAGRAALGGTCRSWTWSGVGMPLPKRARKLSSSEYLSGSSTFMMPNSSSMLFCTGVPAKRLALWTLQGLSCLMVSQTLTNAIIPIRCSSRPDLHEHGALWRPCA